MADTIPLENTTDGGGGGALTEAVGSKRQRRPSVRLGDIISDEIQVYRRTSSKSQQTKNESSKSSKSRALTNLSKINEPHFDKDANLDSVIGSWRVKDSSKRPVKRVRSNWVSKVNSSSGGGDDDIGNGYQDFHQEKNLGNNGYRDFDRENLDNLGDSDREVNHQIAVRSREGNNGDGVEFSGPFDAEGRRDRFGGEDDGVRIWLNGLGLVRYAPVFEIHEVDTEVLPLLTLEDLKDMGINAVGSRRKMFCAIQKLGKGFS